MIDLQAIRAARQVIARADEVAAAMQLEYQFMDWLDAEVARLASQEGIPPEAIWQAIREATLAGGASLAEVEATLRRVDKQRIRAAVDGLIGQGYVDGVKVMRRDGTATYYVRTPEPNPADAPPVGPESAGTEL
ncbi:MAG: hypothetical protein HYY04_11015 [Chloroflexi bacterium]|nr:hypothetical protein [Chloroflexota bacterium]